MQNATWWHDPDSPWMAKLSRAKEHLDHLEGEIKSYMDSGAYEVRYEPHATNERVTVCRLIQHHPIPTRISTIIGDVLHNLRSSLDCMAFELARRHVSVPMTPRDERACAFPIYATLAELDAFFDDKRRVDLFGPRERRAIRDVQPGHLYDEYEQKNISLGNTREEDVEWDVLWVLHQLSNIDKHRYLHLTAYRPDLVYWTSDGASSTGWPWGPPPYEDRSILGYLVRDPDRPEPIPTLITDMRLGLKEPETARENDVCSLLQSMYERILWGVVPGVLNPVWLDEHGQLRQPDVAAAETP